MNDVTEDERSAVEWLRIIERDPQASNKSKRLARITLAALPDALTSPQPALPTVPGTTIYGGIDQPRAMFRLANADRHWISAHGDRYTDNEARELMGEWDEHLPVRERAQVTAAQVDEALHEAHVSGFSGDEWKETFVFALLQIINDGTHA